MKIKLMVELDSGESLELKGDYRDLSGIKTLSELESLVSSIGHGLLPDLEKSLLEQMSKTFVGKKNKEEERP